MRTAERQPCMAIRRRQSRPSRTSCRCASPAFWNTWTKTTAIMMGALWSFSRSRNCPAMSFDRRAIGANYCAGSWTPFWPDFIAIALPARTPRATCGSMLSKRVRWPRFRRWVSLTRCSRRAVLGPFPCVAGAPFSASPGASPDKRQDMWKSAGHVAAKTD